MPFLPVVTLAGRLGRVSATLVVTHGSAAQRTAAFQPGSRETG
jgi:hypothetical protein